MFNEAEVFSGPEAEPELAEIEKHYRKRTRLTTDKLPDDLPVEVWSMAFRRTSGTAPTVAASCERGIKPFVIGRKNFLFANTPRGAKASAILYPLIETAKECGLDPGTYLNSGVPPSSQWQYGRSDCSGFPFTCRI